MRTFLKHLIKEIGKVDNGGMFQLVPHVVVEGGIGFLNQLN